MSTVPYIYKHLLREACQKTECSWISMILHVILALTTMGMFQNKNSVITKWSPPLVLFRVPSTTISKKVVILAINM